MDAETKQGQEAPLARPSTNRKHKQARAHQELIDRLANKIEVAEACGGVVSLRVDEARLLMGAALLADASGNAPQAPSDPTPSPKASP